ncbi:MAG: hypothetical protein PVH62_00215 [Anaerolineae bacterium]
MLSCPACPPVPILHTDEAGNWDLARLPIESEEGIVNLTNSPGRDLGPSLSAEGWWSAFQSDRDGNWEIYTMDFFGRHQTRRTYDPANDTDPVWSPDCVEIGTTCLTGTLAFQSDRTGNWEIFLLDVGMPEGPSQVTTDLGNDADPAWAPDGSALTFQSDRDGNWDIFTILPNGTDEVQRSDNPADEKDPVWSPTGSLIAYVSNRNDNWDLYLLDLESSEETEVASSDGDDLLPSWSPDGVWLAFQSDRDGNQEIYAYNVTTDVLVRLTDDSAADEAPSWDCDGLRVLFHSDRDGDFELYSVSVEDPTDVVQLTDRDSAEQNVLLRPVSEDGSLALEVGELTEEEEEPGEPEPTSAVAPPTEGPAEPAEPPTGAGTNWMLILGIGGLMLIAGLGIGWLVSARKQA